MTRLHEQLTTRLPLEESFAFIADFGNSMIWDPGVNTSEPIGDTPVGLGARYRLGLTVRSKPAFMEYEIVEFEPNRRVVLKGEGSGVSAVDDIRFEAVDGGTRIEYIADINLTGLLRLVQPFAGGALNKIAKDAVEGMQRTLDERAATAGVPAGGR